MKIRFMLCLRKVESVGQVASSEPCGALADAGIVDLDSESVRVEFRGVGNRQRVNRSLRYPGNKRSDAWGVMHCVDTNWVFTVIEGNTKNAT